MKIKTHLCCILFLLIFSVGCSTLPFGGKSKTIKLEGYKTSPHWGEQIKSFVYEPGIKVHINAPANFYQKKPLHLILFALPNGNTTDWTIGKKITPGDNWHFDIQHIGAQTRRLREFNRDENIVTVYLEAEGKSWPSWRRKNPDHGPIIEGLINNLRKSFPNKKIILDISSHSGGGSFITGFIDHFEEIPDWVDRIVYLDSNYSYSNEKKHGDKLLKWLNKNKKNHLVVIAYDDREITWKGKKIVSPTGGTWRATHRMFERFEKDLDLKERFEGALILRKGMNGQANFILHKNPGNKILHTTLVGDMNGFIHSLTLETQDENKAAIFTGPKAFEKWIQP